MDRKRRINKKSIFGLIKDRSEIRFTIKEEDVQKFVALIGGYNTYILIRRSVSGQALKQGVVRGK